jgi:hypothetical protein
MAGSRRGNPESACSVVVLYSDRQQVGKIYARVEYTAGQRLTANCTLDYPRR